MLLLQDSPLDADRVHQDVLLSDEHQCRRPAGAEKVAGLTRQTLARRGPHFPERRTRFAQRLNAEQGVSGAPETRGFSVTVYIDLSEVDDETTDLY